MSLWRGLKPDIFALSEAAKAWEMEGHIIRAVPIPPELEQDFLTALRGDAAATDVDWDS